MNSSKFLVTLSVIGLSIATVTTSLWLGVQSLGELNQANILNVSELPGIEEVTAPLNYEKHLAEGDMLMNNGYYNLAGSQYALAINANPDVPTAYAKLGNTYLALKDYDKALSNFERATKLAPSNTQYHTRYGITLVRLEQFEQALGYFESLNQNNSDVHFYQSLLQAYNENYSESRNQIQLAARYSGEIHPSHIQAVNLAFQGFDLQQEGENIYLEALLTKAMVDVEEFELSRTMALNVLAKQSDYRDVWTLLGYSELKLENYRSAQQALDQAVKIDSIKPEIHYFLGLSHYFLEEYSEAVDRFELALLYGFDPESEPYRKIAESQLFLEDYNEALAAYEHLVRIEQNSIQDYVRPIWLAIEKVQDLDRALTLAQEANTYFPEDAMTHNLLAWVHIERDELDAADYALDQALNLDPFLAEAHYNTGRLREKQGNIKDALSEYKNANTLSEAGDSISFKATEAYNRLIITQEQE